MKQWSERLHVTSYAGCPGLYMSEVHHHELVMKQGLQRRCQAAVQR